MTVANVTAGADITETWGDSVADWINTHTTAITAATGNITTTQTQVVGITIPAATLAAGATYRVRAYGICTSSAANAVTMRVRCGASTLTGSILEDLNPSATTTASADPFTIEALITFRTVGASAAVMCMMHLTGGGSQPFSVQTRVDGSTSTVSVDTTASRILELTAVTAAGTTSVNFLAAVIEQLRP